MLNETCMYTYAKLKRVKAPVTTDNKLVKNYTKPNTNSKNIHKTENDNYLKF